METTANIANETTSIASNVISTNSIMRFITTVLDQPVKIVLIGMLIITIIMLGGLFAEFWQRRYIRIKAAKAIDSIKNGNENPSTIINNSKMLQMHKNVLLEVTNHKQLSPQMKENLAASLLENYNRILNLRVKRSELIVKLGPTFGLLGTLIPLGPGIIALASGDTATLSYSLLAAFDTTVVGLICAAICTVITTIRKNWYAKDNTMLTLMMEAVLEKEIEG